MDKQEDLHPDQKHGERLIELMKLLPPRAAEAVEVPIWTARAWLNQAEAVDFSDVVERGPEAGEQAQSRQRAFRWAGPDDERSGCIIPAAIRPGDMIVVPADYGGCDTWGWDAKSGAPVIDVADAALWPYRGRHFAVRVTPDLIAQGFRRDSLKREQRESAVSTRIIDLDNIRNSLGTKLAENAGNSASELLDAVSEIELPKQIRDQLDVLRQHKGWLEHEFAYGFDEGDRPRGIVFVAPRGLKTGELGRRRGVPATESDDLGSASDRPIPLIVHCEDVRDCAQNFAVRAGLSPNEIADVVLAAFLHDAGKADPRYQAYFMGGDPYGPDAEQVLAKSGQKVLPRGAWKRAGLPSNWRHEGLSVRLAMIHPDFPQARDPELVLWLIGTHHGCGRPLFPHADAKDAEHRAGLLKAYDLDCDLMPGPGPQSLAFDFGGWDWAQMFERLKQRYGIWGLARLETFIRLADHRVSESSRDSGEQLREAAE
jgi:CRISPR-associated endonuclease/helicase Cas3